VSSSLATEYGPYTDVIMRVTVAFNPLASVGALAGSASADSSIAFGFEILVSNIEQLARTTSAAAPSVATRGAKP